MEQIVLIVHLAVSLAIIGLIMLQQGKGADMGASFGAGASQTLFGSDGSGNVLSRATALLVAVFFATSFGLAIIATQQSAPADDLGIPEESAPVQSVDDLPQSAPDSEIPTLDDAPAAASGTDVPVLEDDTPAVTAPE